MFYIVEIIRIGQERRILENYKSTRVTNYLPRIQENQTFENENEGRNLRFIGENHLYVYDING